jgi:hypothetical protein
MNKSKKSDVNRQEVNIGTKRTDASNKLETQGKKQRKVDEHE